MGRGIHYYQRDDDNIEAPPEGAVSFYRNQAGLWKIKNPDDTTEEFRPNPQAVSKSGYDPSVRGSVTQLTSKSTAVELNALGGTVTVHNENLAAGSSASFVMSNSYAEEGDLVTAVYAGGGTAGAYSVGAYVSAAGEITFYMLNTSGGTLGEGFNIQFKLET